MDFYLVLCRYLWFRMDEENVRLCSIRREEVYHIGYRRYLPPCSLSLVIRRVCRIDSEEVDRKWDTMNLS